MNDRLDALQREIDVLELALRGLAKFFEADDKQGFALVHAAKANAKEMLDEARAKTLKPAGPSVEDL
jgi:hypothetical protein